MIFITGSERTSRILNEDNYRNSLSISAEAAGKNFMNFTVDRNDPLLRFSDYIMSKENLECNVSGEEVLVKAMTASVEELKKN